MASVDLEMRTLFRPEFLNRLDDRIIFQSLTREDIESIVEIQIHQLEKRLEDQQLRLEISAEARRLLAREGYDPQFGARPLKRTIQSMVLDPLAMRMLEGEFAPGDSVLADVHDDGLVFSCATKSED